MDFKDKFLDFVKKNNPKWEIKGLLSCDKDVLVFGSDTKVLSTIFELLCKPIVLSIAKELGYQIEEAPQTVYPDFTLLRNKEDKEKIAVDIKTTYRKILTNGSVSPFGFTLGSYTSFIRNGTKNIRYPYSDYKEHWIIGFVYTRNLPENISLSYKLSEFEEIPCPYKDVEFFVQEKYKIAGLKPGSGNTTNIGSIKTSNIDDFRVGKGAFAKKGEKAFLNYWRKYK